MVLLTVHGVAYSYRFTVVVQRLKANILFVSVFTFSNFSFFTRFVKKVEANTALSSCVYSTTSKST